MNRLNKLSLIASMLITSTVATATVDINQIPKFFDATGNTLISNIELDKRMFSTILGGDKNESDVVKDGIGLFIYTPSSNSKSIINNNIEVYNDLIEQYNKELPEGIPFDDWFLSRTFDPNTEVRINELIVKGIIDEKYQGPLKSPELVILSNGTVTCPDATPGDILNDGLGGLYLVVDNTTIRNYSSNITFGANSNIFDAAHICTTHVTSMDSLFNYVDGGYDITGPLDISNWDTSNVTDMTNMFASSNLEISDISNWDTSNVTSIAYMFFGSSYQPPETSTWSTPNLQNNDDAFAYILLDKYGQYYKCYKLDVLMCTDSSRNHYSWPYFYESLYYSFHIGDPADPFYPCTWGVAQRYRDCYYTSGCPTGMELDPNGSKCIKR